MNKKIKILSTASIIGAVALAGITSISYANNKTQQLTTAHTQTTTAHAHHFKHSKTKHHQPFWNFGFHHNKHFNHAEAKKITEAALLMQGKRHFAVNDVNDITSKHGHKVFTIKIQNTLNKKTRDILFNPRNGHIRPA